jgi:hypothetical protein
MLVVGTEPLSFLACITYELVRIDFGSIVCPVCPFITPVSSLNAVLGYAVLGIGFLNETKFKIEIHAIPGVPFSFNEIGKMMLSIQFERGR